MSKIADTIFEILRCEINSVPLSEDTVKKFDNPDFTKQVYEFARSHNLSHYVSDALMKKGFVKKGDKLYKSVSTALMLEVYKFSQLKDISDKMYSLFEENEIDYIPLKGAVVNTLYPKPWMRTSCDVDVFIKKEQLDKAISLLKEKFGCTAGHTGEHDVPIYFENGFHVELHFSLYDKGFAFNPVLDGVWNYTSLCDGYSHRYEMTDEMFYFYHIAHMAKHVKNGGCGIKPFIDMWILNKVEHNEEKRRELLEKGKLVQFEKTARKLSESWMSGVKSDELKPFENYILSGGVYGTADNKTAAKSVYQDVFRVSRVFLPLSELKYQYNVLEKYPILYPICIIRRIGRLLFITLPEVIKNRITHRNKTKSKEISSLMKKLGI